MKTVDARHDKLHTLFVFCDLLIKNCHSMLSYSIFLNLPFYRVLYLFESTRVFEYAYITRIIRKILKFR